MSEQAPLYVTVIKYSEEVIEISAVDFDDAFSKALEIKDVSEVLCVSYEDPRM